MKLHKKYQVLVFFFISTSIFSQKIILKGNVKDNQNRPLSYANVIAKPKNISKKMKFAITDEEGYYRLFFNQGDTVTISIIHLGYKKISHNFIAEKSTTKDFRLDISNEELDEIIIEAPVKVRGDTITYNTDKFITGEERKLKNVLKKLPGVEVSKNGEVTVLGKKVTKMLVDGKKFFGGNSKLAVDNIPADAVGGVDVIDNYNEIAFLKNLSDSEEMAMNIKLKENKKRFIFGDIEVNKGNSNFFKTLSNLFYYSPKININFIGNINNIGIRAFTYRDYLGFRSTINPVFGGKLNWRNSNFSEFLKDKDVLESNQKFGAFNIVRSKEKLNMSSFLIFSKSDTKNIFQTQNNYSTFNELRNSENLIDNLIGIGRYNLQYSPIKNERWLVNTELKLNNNNVDNQISSTANSNEVNVFTNRDLNTQKINQIFEWHKRYSDSHTSSSVLNYNYQKNNRFNLWNTNDEILQGLIPIIQGQDNLTLHQNIYSEKHSLGFIFKYFWEINNNNHLYITLGNSYLKHLFKTRDFQLLDNNDTNDFSPEGFNNDLQFTLNDFFIEQNYKFNLGILTINQGLEIHKFNWRIEQSNLVQKSKIILLPKLSAKIQFNKSKKILFNYRLRSSFSDASKFANRFYLRSYNSVFKGNAAISNNLFHNASLYYSRFSLYRGLIFSTNINYTKQTKGNQNTVEFDGVNQFLTTQMFDNPSESIRIRSSIYKKINNIRYKFDGTISSAKFIQKIDNLFQTNKNENYSYSIGFETLYENFPTIDIGFKRTIGKFTSNNTSRFIINEPFFTFGYDFWKGFIFSFDYRLYDYKNKSLNQKNKFDTANFTLSYQKENSAWTYKVFSNNIFNTRFKRNFRFNQYLISDTKTFILPRVIMIGIGYNL